MIILNSGEILSNEGFWLTNGEGIYSKRIFLGAYDKPGNWVEITEERYQEILKEQEESYET